MQKLTVGHDGTGIGAGWYLNKVAVQNMRSHYKLDFVAKRWLDEGEGDKALEITIPGALQPFTHYAPVQSIATRG